ncbi:MAG TPA: GNAT family N-acetyltransferase [Anaerolineales bacterium]|jgi:GNAT superfamily N-acetyltransferase
MKPGSEITIKTFQPDNQDEVKQLILAGLVQHFGVLDPHLNPDLNDIASSYAGAIFLVAWHQARIVGTGALIPRSTDGAEIVRMSVAQDMRRMGIGRLLLLRLCEKARIAGYNHLVLETTSTWHEVITFYQQFGFHITHQHNGDTYFALDLSELPDR